MIACDAWLVEFISKNVMTMGIVGGIVTIMAKQLKWGWLEQIVSFLGDRITGRHPIIKETKKED